jgi:uncharacterized protein YunC (DUF1805 family)
LLPYTIVEVKGIDIDEKKVIGVKIELPNSPPLLVIRGERGFIMCGYLDIKVAEKLGLVAARVTGVKSIEEMIDKEIVEATSKALENNIAPGMKVRDILKNL